MQELEVTWLRAIQVWWSMVWRLVVVSTIVGIIIGVVLGLFANVLGITSGTAVVAQLIGMAMGIPIGIWAMKVVLSMEYAGFRVALLPSSEAVLKERENRLVQDD